MSGPHPALILVLKLYLCKYPPGAIALVHGVYSEADAPLLIRDVSCNGSESALLDCPYNTFTQTSCGPFSDAGIVCQGMLNEVKPIKCFKTFSTANDTTIGACSDGELQLSNQSDDDVELTRSGRVELCLNNAWGTVCGTSFSVPDVLVTCNQLIGFQREG